jgi:hypothetical protein
MRAEVENNLVLGIAAGLANDPTLAKESPYFATVQGDSGVVVCAIRTPPYPLAITRSHEQDALKLLAEDAFSLYPELNEVVGPEPTVGLFANLWAGMSGSEPRRDMQQRIHEIRSVQALDNRPRGDLRPATDSDLKILTPWVAGFVKEVGISEKKDPAELVRERLKNRSLFVWDDAGPVSMAAWAGKTPNGVRINFVYTPENLRRQGYATACVAALTQLLLERDNKYCSLYTNLANPTSNAIYQRIGYRPVCDFAQYGLAV